MTCKRLNLSLLCSVLLCTASFAGKIPEELKEFSHTTYNSLPLSGEADSNLKQNGRLHKFLEEVTPLVEEQGLTESIGFRLAHRHDVVQQGEKMVERFDYWKEKPSFITTIEKEDAPKTYPASWLYTSSGLKVFEYSSDPEVKKVIKSLSDPQKFFEKIGEIAEKYELKGILSPAILGRSSFAHFNTEQPLYELISPEPYASVLINKSLEEIEQETKNGGNLVRTTWALKNPQTPIVCINFCHWVDDRIHWSYWH